MPISKCPKNFEGYFSLFFEQHIAPNLPPPQHVLAFDALIKEYVASSSAHFIIRHSRGMIRGELILTPGGDFILPSDNSPAWWVHATLLEERPLSSPKIFFENIPTHMFSLSKMMTLNKAGYHLAHIIGVGNGDTNWKAWNRQELCRRFLLNVHPFNWFLLAHDQGKWARQGHRQDIIRWVENAYLERYGDLYLAFRTRVGYPLSPSEKEVPDAKYDVGTEFPPSPSSVIRKNRPHQKAHSLIALNRPLISKRYIGTMATLDIKTLGLRYILPHDDLVAWAETNTSMSTTRSWRDIGTYSWPKPTRSMLSFLSLFRVKE